MTFFKAWVDSSPQRVERISGRTSEGIGGVRVLWVQYLRANLPHQYLAGLFLSSKVRPRDIDEMVAACDEFSRYLNGANLLLSDIRAGDVMDHRLFTELHLNHDVILVGESHGYDEDLNLILAILQGFVEKQRKLLFLFEHLPGREIGARLRTLIKSRDSLADFFDNERFDIPGVGQQKTPIQAWERPESRDRLLRLFQFARNNNIQVIGHDAPFEEQTEKAMSEGAQKSLDHRDDYMVSYCARILNKYPHLTLLCFVGAYHLGPQLKRFKEQYAGFNVVGLGTSRTPKGVYMPNIRMEEANRWQVLAA